MSLRLRTNLRANNADGITTYGRGVYITTGQVWIIVHSPAEA